MNYDIEIVESFKKDVKKLQKKFKNIKSDIIKFSQNIYENLLKAVSLGGNYYKVRISNSSIPTDKSSGFRIVLLLVVDEKIVLLRIYSKTEKENLTDEEFQNLFTLYKSGKI